MKKSLMLVLALFTLSSLHAAPQQQAKKAIKNQTKKMQQSISSDEIKISAAMQAVIDAVLAGDQDQVAVCLKQGIEAGDVQVKAICGAIIMDVSRIDVELSTIILEQLGITVDQLRAILPEPNVSKVVMAIAQILMSDESMQELLADVVEVINNAVNASAKTAKKNASKNAPKKSTKKATKQGAPAAKKAVSARLQVLMDVVAAQDDQAVATVLQEGVQADDKQIIALAVLALFVAAGKTPEEIQAVLVEMGVTPQDVPQPIDVTVLIAIVKAIATDKAIENLLLEKMQAQGVVVQDDMPSEDAEQSAPADEVVA